MTTALLNLILWPSLILIFFLFLFVYFYAFKIKLNLYGEGVLLFEVKIKNKRFKYIETQETNISLYHSKKSGRFKILLGEFDSKSRQKINLNFELIKTKTENSILFPVKFNPAMNRKSDRPIANVRLTRSEEKIIFEIYWKQKPITLKSHYKVLDQQSLIKSRKKHYFILGIFINQKIQSTYSSESIMRHITYNWPKLKFEFYQGFIFGVYYSNNILNINKYIRKVKNYKNPKNRYLFNDSILIENMSHKVTKVMNTPSNIMAAYHDIIYECFPRYSVEETSVLKLPYKYPSKNTHIKLSKIFNFHIQQDIIQIEPLKIKRYKDQEQTMQYFMPLISKLPFPWFRLIMRIHHFRQKFERDIIPTNLETTYDMPTFINIDIEWLLKNYKNNIFKKIVYISSTNEFHKFPDIKPFYSELRKEDIKFGFYINSISKENLDYVEKILPSAIIIGKNISKNVLDIKTQIWLKNIIYIAKKHNLIMIYNQPVENISETLADSINLTHYIPNDYPNKYRQ